MDIWRALHPSDRSFTWLRPNAYGAAVSRMNLVALPTFWVPFVSSFNHLPCPFSDHCVVALSFVVPQVLTGGPEVWKLNVSVLVEEDYFSLISSFWASWRERKSDFVTVMDWWEVAKSMIKGLSVTYSKTRAARLRSRRDFLVRLVSYLKERVYVGRCHRVDPYQAALAELRQLGLVEVEGARVCARVRWVEEGECSSSYFCKLEKKRCSESGITALRNSDNVVHTGGEGIQSVLSSFYADHFSKEETDLAFKRPFCSKYLIESLLIGLACFPLLCCFFGYGEGKGPGY